MRYRRLGRTGFTVSELGYGAWGIGKGVDALRSQVARERLSLDVVEIDVNTDRSVSRGVRQILGRAGRIDGLVNNAGFGVAGPWEMTTTADAKRQFETNFFGVHRMSRAVVPAMRAQGGGTIINVGSDAGIRATFFEALYAASKFALEALSQGMRWELRQFGIKVCVLNPGWYVSDFSQSMVRTIDYENPTGPYRPMLESLNKGKKGSPNPRVAEVAESVVRLLEMDDPPLRNMVGCAPIRVADVSLDQYERELFALYEVERFRAPQAGA
jgi:short-subunit dehydrogenase